MGRGFEVILAILEEDETVDLHFTSATNKVPLSINFSLPGL